MGRISRGPTRWPPGAERRLVPAKSNLKPQSQKTNNAQRRGPGHPGPKTKKRERQRGRRQEEKKKQHGAAATKTARQKGGRGQPPRGSQRPGGTPERGESARRAEQNKDNTAPRPRAPGARNQRQRETQGRKQEEEEEKNYNKAPISNDEDRETQKV